MLKGTLGDLLAGTADVFADMALLRDTVPIKISSVTASGAATIVFDADIDATFDVYEFDLTSLVPSSDGADLYARVSTDGGATWKSGGSDYWWEEINYGGGAGGAADSADSEIQLTRIGVGNVGGECISLKVLMYRPADTSVKTYFKWEAVYFTAFPALITLTGGAAYQATTAVDAIQFFFSSGNASGKASMRGYKI